MLQLADVLAAKTTAYEAHRAAMKAAVEAEAAAMKSREAAKDARRACKEATMVARRIEVSLFHFVLIQIQKSLFAGAGRDSPV